ncbi:MAG TPA: universal stress protein [Gaiellaceae bacterium]|nr:universal stress protein [Gaiellaceae bacterium]
MRAPASGPTGNDVPGGGSIFEHVLVGIDDTPESVIAAAQAGVLRAPGGQLALVAVAEKHLATHAGVAAAHAGDAVLAATADELALSRELVDADDAMFASGRLVDLLCRECATRGATLIAVGVRPHHRLAALTFGGHDVDALHEARCSVLIGRPGWGPSKPERIVVGVDASPESRLAEAAARSLADRLGCRIVPVVGLGDDVDPATLRAKRQDALLDPRSLVDAVVAASRPDSLVLVGRAPEHGHRWGGTLVERVVYGARCSVLVVQPPAASG